MTKKISNFPKEKFYNNYLKCGCNTITKKFKSICDDSWLNLKDEDKIPDDLMRILLKNWEGIQGKKQSLTYPITIKDKIYETHKDLRPLFISKLLEYKKDNIKEKKVVLAKNNVVETEEIKKLNTEISKLKTILAQNELRYKKEIETNEETYRQEINNMGDTYIKEIEQLTREKLEYLQLYNDKKLDIESLKEYIKDLKEDKKILREEKQELKNEILELKQK
jgi:hypothetical protein